MESSEEMPNVDSDTDSRILQEEMQQRLVISDVQTWASHFILQDASEIIGKSDASIEDEKMTLSMLHNLLSNYSPEERPLILSEISEQDLLLRCSKCAQKHFIHLNVMAEDDVDSRLSMQDEENSRWQLLTLLFQIVIQILEFASQHPTCREKIRQQLLHCGILKPTQTRLQSTAQQEHLWRSMQSFGDATTEMLNLHVAALQFDLRPEPSESWSRALESYIITGDGTMRAAAGIIQNHVESQLTPDNTQTHLDDNCANNEPVNAAMGKKPHVSQASGENSTSRLQRLLAVFDSEKYPVEDKISNPCHIDVGIPSILCKSLKQWIQSTDPWGILDPDTPTTDVVLGVLSTLEEISEAPHTLPMLLENQLPRLLHTVLCSQRVLSSIPENQTAVTLMGYCLQIMIHLLNALLNQTHLVDSLISHLSFKPCYRASLTTPSHTHHLPTLHLLALMARFNHNETKDVAINLSAQYTYMLLNYVRRFYTHPPTIEVIADLIAKSTRLPKELVETFQEFVSEEETHDEERWSVMHAILNCLQLFMGQSEPLCRRLKEEGLGDCAFMVFSSSYFMSRKSQPHEKHLIEGSCAIVGHLLEVTDTIESLPPSFREPVLWENIYDYARNPAQLSVCHDALTAFVHMHRLLQLHEETRLLVDGPELDIDLGVYPLFLPTDEGMRLYDSLYERFTKTKHEKWVAEFVLMIDADQSHCLVLGRCVSEGFPSSSPTYIGALIRLMVQAAQHSQTYVTNCCTRRLLKTICSLLQKNTGSRKAPVWSMVQSAMILVLHMASYAVCRDYFSVVDVVPALYPYTQKNQDLSMRVTAVLAIVKIRQLLQMDSLPADFVLQTPLESELELYKRLYEASQTFSLQQALAHCFVKMHLPQMLVIKLKQVLENDHLEAEGELVADVICVMRNFTETSAEFGYMLREEGVLPYIQRMLTHPALKLALHGCSSKTSETMLMSSLRLLFNLAQYPENHADLHSLKIINDLLHLPTQDSPPSLQFMAHITTACLVKGNNLHLLRVSSSSRVMGHLILHLRKTCHGDKYTSDSFSQTQLLVYAEKLCLQDSNQCVFVYEGGVPVLARILQSSTCEPNVFRTLMVLWLLTFHEDNVRCVGEEEGLMRRLREMENRPHSCEQTVGQGDLWEKIKWAAGGLLFRLDESMHKYHLKAKLVGGIQSRELYLIYHSSSHHLFSQLTVQLQSHDLTVVSRRSSVDAQMTCSFEELGAHIKRARLVVVEVSEACLHDVQIRTEISYAQNLRRPIICVRTGKLPSDWMGRLVAQNDTIDMVPQRGSTGTECVQQVAAYLTAEIQCLQI